MCNGRPCWRPTYYDVSKRSMLIRADADPKDEIRRFIVTCVSVWLTRYGAWSYDKEKLEELEQECYYRTYKLLCDKVRSNEYRRDLSFYLNVRSCAWSSVSHVYKDWVDEQRTAMEQVSIYDTIPGMAGDNAHTYIENVHKRLLPASVANQRLTEERSIDSYESPAAKAKSALAHIEFEWLMYLEACDEHGVEPVDKDVWITDNMQDLLAVVEEVHSDKQRKTTYWSHYRKAREAADPQWAEARRRYQREYFRRKRAEKKGSPQC